MVTGGMWFLTDPTSLLISPKIRVYRLNLNFHTAGPNTVQGLMVSCKVDVLQVVSFSSSGLFSEL